MPSSPDSPVLAPISPSIPQPASASASPALSTAASSTTSPSSRHHNILPSTSAISLLSLSLNGASLDEASEQAQTSQQTPASPPSRRAASGPFISTAHQRRYNQYRNVSSASTNTHSMVNTSPSTSSTGGSPDIAPVSLGSSPTKLHLTRTTSNPDPSSSTLTTNHASRPLAPQTPLSWSSSTPSTGPASTDEPSTPTRQTARHPMRIALPEDEDVLGSPQLNPVATPSEFPPVTPMALDSNGGDYVS